MPTVTTPSTERVKLFRIRKRINEISRDAGWTLAALQQYFGEYDIPVSTWTSAQQFFDATITDENLPVKTFFSDDWESFIEYLNDDPGIEKATLRQGLSDIMLIRPKFLGTALNE